MSKFLEEHNIPECVTQKKKTTLIQKNLQKEKPSLETTGW